MKRTRALGVTNFFDGLFSPALPASTRVVPIWTALRGHRGVHTHTPHLHTHTQKKLHQRVYSTLSLRVETSNVN